MTTPLHTTDLERLADIYHESEIGKTTGLRMSFADDGAATCSFAHSHRFDHALDQVHGGLLATMLDNAGWFTAAACHAEWVVTADMHIRLLNGTSGEDLRATGSVVRMGKRHTIVAMDLFAASGLHVAMATGTFCPTGKPLPFAVEEGMG